MNEYPKVYLDLVVEEMKKYKVPVTQENLEKVLDFIELEMRICHTTKRSNCFISLGIIQAFAMPTLNPKQYEKRLKDIEEFKKIVNQ